jgi:hypothetical protein
MPVSGFEIRVKGLAGPTTRAAFPDLDLRSEGANTVLRVRVADQAALYGVLVRIQNLGMELLEIRPVEGE